MAKSKKPKKDNDLFATINSISSKKHINYSKKEANAYMLNLWLSHDKNLMPYVNKINNLKFELPDELVYKYYFKKIPKKNRYIKWIPKLKKTKMLEKEITFLCEKYNISRKEAKLSIPKIV